LSRLFRENWEIVYAFNPIGFLQDASKDVHKALRAVYPEGDRTFIERRSKIRALNLEVGAKGTVKAGGYDLASLKMEAEVAGKMVVGSTSLSQTLRPRTRSLCSELVDIRSNSAKKHLLILDKAPEYPVPSLRHLGASIRAEQDRFRLVLLCKSDIDIQDLGDCDKCELSYNPVLTDVIYTRFHQNYSMFSKSAIGRILEKANGVPSRLAQKASIIYGAYKLLRKNSAIDEQFVEEILGQSA
jgi:hypothetical protein